jgi:hypothetical protein
MAAANEEASKRAGLHNWKTPKMEHAKFMLRLMQSSIPWIICLRAKYKTRQTKDEKGKTVIVKDDETTPIQADDFIFEMTAHAEILHDHSIRLTKCSHPSLRDCFPKDGPITIQTGEAIARWCAAGASANTSGAQQATTNPAASPASTEDAQHLKALKKRLFTITQPKHGGNPAALEQWLWDEAILDVAERLSDLKVEQLEQLLVKVEGKLK